MQVWPAIDLRGGKCVRLRQGDYGRETVFSDDPVTVAAQWVRQGATCLHLVDLDGARDGSSANHSVAHRIAQSSKVPCQLGGGIRNEETIASLLESGLSRLVVGTQALKEPAWFRQMCDKFPEKLTLGLDARNGLVATDGWMETSEVAAIDLVNRFSHQPIAAVVYTDIAKDGMMAGPNFAAMAEMNNATDLPVVASGGITTANDVQRLAELGLAGCIIGRTLYEGKLSLGDAIDAASAQEKHN